MACWIIFIKLGLEWFSIFFNHVIYYFYNFKTFNIFGKIILFCLAKKPKYVNGHPKNYVIYVIGCILFILKKNLGSWLLCTGMALLYGWCTDVDSVWVTKDNQVLLTPYYKLVTVEVPSWCKWSKVLFINIHFLHMYI